MGVVSIVRLKKGPHADQRKSCLRRRWLYAPYDRFRTFTAKCAWKFLRISQVFEARDWLNRCHLLVLDGDFFGRVNSFQWAHYRLLPGGLGLINVDDFNECLDGLHVANRAEVRHLYSAPFAR